MLKLKQAIFDPRRSFNIYSDFVYGVGDFSTNTTGTGAATNVFPGSDGDALGILRMNCGAASGSWARLGISIQSVVVYFDMGEWIYRSRTKFSHLPVAPDPYMAYVGFVQYNNFLAGYAAVRVTETNPNFELALNPGVSGRPIVSYDTGVPVEANKWYTIEIKVNAEMTEVTAVINDVIITKPITSLQLSTAFTNFGQFIQSTGGTINDRAMFIDFAQCRCNFNTVR